MAAATTAALAVVVLVVLLGVQHGDAGFPRPSYTSLEATPWPKPSKFSNGTGLLVLAPPERFSFRSSSSSKLLQQALTRYASAMTNQPTLCPPHAAQPSSTDSLDGLTVTVESDSEVLADTTDESYDLQVGPGSATIHAATVFGALHGLESFLHLVEVNRTGGYQIRGSPWVIHDSPRFIHRGLLIDTSRHYLPISAILSLVDGMSQTKLNVLHWHMVDAESFPLISVSAPYASWGAYGPDEVYHLSDVQNVVQYAKARGVRVMVEVDTPGHANAFGYGYPSIVVPCGSNVENTPVDPTNNFTYTVISDIFSDLNTVLEDNFFHLGGDEVVYGCWRNSPHIMQFMQDHGMGTDCTKLEEYYEKLLLELSNKALPNRNFVMYQEVFDSGSKLPSNIVIDVWKTDPPLIQEVEAVVRAGYRAIIANGPNDEWYLNEGFGNGVCDDIGCRYTHWTAVYKNEPLAGTTLTPTQQKLVLGGEASLWGEEINGDNLATVAWPRAAAFAERMWSPEDVNDYNEAAPRIARMYCKMRARGVQVSPISPGSCTHF